MARKKKQNSNKKQQREKSEEFNLGTREGDEIRKAVRRLRRIR